jgi:acyl transferase domain-containing protein/phosphopantetheinyl transferase (holo-ACP synthase)
MREPIAIVGMAAVFPGAPDLATYWKNLEAGVDAIGDVPATRWDPVYFDPAARAIDRFYCRRGGFVEPTFDPLAFGIMPVTVRGAEPDQLLALAVAAAALDDAGVAVPRESTGVILGRGGYLTSGMARLVNGVRTAQQLVTTLAELVPSLDAETLERVRVAFQQRAGEELGPEQAIGLVPNLAASRIANRLDLRGPAYTIDAACASSLLAVDQGCRELEARRCDLVLAGGVHVCHDVTFWSVFTQLGALSRAQQIRPFDRKADGILIGEGAGVVVLERLEDAERAGHRVYAVIRGTGVSSDGREASPMRPRLDGQLAALDAAWRGIDRTAVGLVEAHGTATPTGDGVELRALAQFFGPADAGGAPRACVGSVKSMIGHAMPAAGAAGLIKAALALHHGVLPPSLHCDEPHPELSKTRFRVLSAAEPWQGPRRAGVSAFGFGGINAHVVLDAHGAARRTRNKEQGTRNGERAEAAVPMLAVAGDTIEELRGAIERGEGALEGAMRLAMLDPTAERRQIALKVLERGQAWRGNRDMWFAPKALGGSVAFVFPGIEAAFAPDVEDVARGIGVPLPEAIIDAAGAGAETARDLERRGLGVFALGRLLAAALARLGVAPAAIAGHSVGEWTGMVASEMIPPDAAAAFVAGLAPGSLEVPDVVFVAAGCGATGARAALDGLDGIAVSHDNCPHQSILCGRRDAAAAAVARLAERGVLCQELPFRSGFHSPLFADYLAPHRAHLADLALQRPRIPLWSATTCAPYPADPAAIRALAIEHLVAPVRFRELIEAMYASGIRTFVQLGVGNLAGFVDDTLRGRDYLAIAAAPSAGKGKRTSGLAQLARVVAALWVEHVGSRFPVPGSLFPVPDQHEAHGIGNRGTGNREPGNRPEARLASKPLPLPLGAPLVHLDGAIPPLTLSTLPTANPSDPILSEALATLRDAAAASHAILDAWQTAQRRAGDAPVSATIRRALSVDLEPALLDHCFYRQPDGWPTVSDRYPVVPMTMTIGMMIDAARRTAPGKVAVAVEDVRAYRWLAVAPPLDAELRVTRTGDAADVDIPGYARATVRLADAYPPAPAPQLAPLTAPRATPITAERLYVDRWMFHGPRYQGVVGLGPMGDDGVDGMIETLPAPGALLDCAGQLMGWWVMQTEARDRLAMPVHVERIALFGPEPTPGTRVACCVRMRAVEEREVRADLELAVDGRLWAKIDGWADRRFDSDDAVWAILMYPEHNALAVLRDGYVEVTEHWRAAASRELMMRRYLGERERAQFAALPPRRQRGWLLGRIAIKDAVRRHLWDGGAGPMFPVEVEVTHAASGQPLVNVANLRVSVAHKEGRAVAIVGEGRAVGIDLERVAPRAEGFAAVAFAPEELALGEDREPLDWQTRLWTAKEAVGKLRGTGVTDPRALVVRAVDGDRLVIEDIVVETRRDGDDVVAWCTEGAS